MDVYYAPAWGRHYTATPEGGTRWLTDAEEADVAARTTPQQGLFTPGAGDGAFDALIRPATPRSGLAPAGPADAGAAASSATPSAVSSAAWSAVSSATSPARSSATAASTGPQEADVPAPRRPSAVAVAVVAGTLGLVVGLVLGSTGVAAGSDEPGGGRPVAEVPAGG